MIIADLLGVPPADREQIHRWSDTIGRNRGGTEPGPLMDAHAAMLEFHAYVEAMLVEHRGRPVGGLVSSLVDAEQQESLTAKELAVMFQMLLFAGHETTTNLIGSGLLALLSNPCEWRALHAHPELVPNAVEELLRYVTPVQHSSRVALVDVEIAGTAIRAGTTVRLLTAAANRDPEVFVDPDRLDVRRENARDHLALGFGLHFCLGASLARLEGALALGRIAERFPELELATDDLHWTGSATLRRLESLPVSLGRSR
jgi:cytochrome P450